MRRFLTAALVLCAAAAMFMDAQAAQQSKLIQVRITCNGGAIGDFSINELPEAQSRAHSTELSKSAGGTADFILVGTSSVDTVTVVPKGGAWPFAGDSLEFGRGCNRSTGAINPNIELGSYAYDLIVTCNGISVGVDPKMDIVP